MRSHQRHGFHPIEWSFFKGTGRFGMSHRHRRFMRISSSISRSSRSTCGMSTRSWRIRSQVSFIVWSLSLTHEIYFDFSFSFNCLHLVCRAVSTMSLAVLIESWSALLLLGCGSCGTQLVEFADCDLSFFWGESVLLVPEQRCLAFGSPQLFWVQ